MLKSRQPLPASLVLLVEGFQFENPDTRWILARGEPGTGEYLEGFFEDEDQAQSEWKALRASVGPDLPPLALHPLEDRDWKEAYKFHLKLWDYGPLAWIPAWERDTAQVPAGVAARVVLDSGMAFGTGSHETTRLCAEALVDFTANQREVTGLRVVDAGCGSGILALSAAALGYDGVRGFDNDPEAVRISRDNAVANGMEARVTFTVDDLENGLEAACADLLLANIETPILAACCEPLLAAVAAGGRLVMSGILARDAAGLARAFQERSAVAWGREAVPAISAMGEWARLVLDREEGAI